MLSAVSQGSIASHARATQLWKPPVWTDFRKCHWQANLARQRRKPNHYANSELLRNGPQNQKASATKEQLTNTSGIPPFPSGKKGMRHGVACAATCTGWVSRIW